MRRSRNFVFVRLAGLLMLVGSQLPTLAAEPIEISGAIFGTTYSVKLDSSRAVRKDLQAAIESRLNQIDALMSTWRDDSDVSRFNLSTSTDWYAVDAETAAVVDRAQEISRATNGMFDITVGPAVRLWNFGSGGTDEFAVPSDKLIAETLAIVGHDRLEARIAPPAIRKSVPGLRIDLSAIAKGYAVDAVAELLLKSSYDSFMVEIGGEVRAQGRKHDGSSWRIGLESPKRNAREIEAVVSLNDVALATSGDYRNFFELDGQIYSHTIDPRTARPVTHGLAAVSVIAEDCASADAFATAMLAMGPEVGAAWAKQNQISAMFFVRSANNIERVATSGFPQLEVATRDMERAEGSFLQLFLATAVVFGIAILAMSVGTIIANRRLKGSCGGMAGLKDSHGKTVCEMCTRPSPECAGNSDADVPVDSTTR